MEGTKGIRVNLMVWGGGYKGNLMTATRFVDGDKVFRHCVAFPELSPARRRVEEDVRLQRSVELIGQRRKMETHIKAMNRNIRTQIADYRDELRNLEEYCKAQVARIVEVLRPTQMHVPALAPGTSGCRPHRDCWWRRRSGCWAPRYR